MNNIRKIKLAITLPLLGTTMVCVAEEFPVATIEGEVPMMAQYYLGCKAINQYITTNKVEYLEDALHQMNPKRLEVSRFEPEMIVDESNLCNPTDHFVYDYEYALAIYEDRELPREMGLQRAGGECKVALLALKPESTIIYKLEAVDHVEILTICEPGSVVSVNATESTTGKSHIGKLYDDNTVCHVSWDMEGDTIEISITNQSGHITSMAFLIN